MKSIRTTTIAIVGAALLTLGALTGCSSDSGSASGKTSAADSKSDSKSGDDSKSGGDAKGGTEDAANFDIDCAEYTTVFAEVDPPTDMTDMDAAADYYDDLAAKASGGMKNALEAMAEAIRNPQDAAAAQRALDATQAWNDAAMECAAG